jgi:Uncharacterized protein conserved in bacteria (DUF2252)
MVPYAELCGWILSRAHDCSGEPAKISADLGKLDTFDRTIADFSIASAGQCERDHATLA